MARSKLHKDKRRNKKFTVMVVYRYTFHGSRKDARLDAIAIRDRLSYEGGPEAAKADGIPAPFIRVIDHFTGEDDNV